MGRKANICINNNSDIKLEISYDNVSCLYRSGEDGSSFDSISGVIEKNGKLPCGKDFQLLVKELGGRCVINNGFFTMLVKDASTKKELATIRFEADNRGYRVIKAEVESEIDVNYTEIQNDQEISAIKLVIQSPQNKSLADFPYCEVIFNEDAEIIERHIGAKIKKTLELHHQNVTDLFIFIHGFNNTAKAARDIYKNYFQKLREEAGESCNKIAVCGIIWPSQESDEETWKNTLYFEKMLHRAKKVGANLVPVLADLKGRFRLHLSGHSLGTVALAKALVQSLEAGVFFDSVFLIQSALPVRGNLYECSQDWLLEYQRKTGVSIVATYTENDGMLKLLNILVQAIGLQGFEKSSIVFELLRTIDLKPGGQLSPADFGANFIELNCKDLFTHPESAKIHDDYKKKEVARAHLLAAELTNRLKPLGNHYTKSSPFVAGDWVYFQGTDDKLWKVRTDGSDNSHIGGHYTKSSPFVVGDWVYFQGTDDKLWKIKTDGGDNSHIGGHYTKSSPFVVGDWVYFRGTDDKLWKIKTDGGDNSHIYATVSSPFVVGNWVYCQGMGNKLWKIIS